MKNSCRFLHAVLQKSLVRGCEPWYRLWISKGDNVLNRPVERQNFFQSIHCLVCLAKTGVLIEKNRVLAEVFLDLIPFPYAI